MTPQEVAQLLAIDATFTGRTIDAPMVQSWHAVVGDLDGRDCVDALRAYYRESTDGRWMMPGHIVARVRTMMLARREQKQLEEFHAAQGSIEDRERVRLAIEGAKTALATEAPKVWPKSDRANKCKWCGAEPGRPCMTPGTSRVLTGVHPSRLEGAA